MSVKTDKLKAVFMAALDAAPRDAAQKVNCGGRRQTLDLTQLAGLPLDFLCINFTHVTDLSPLKDLPLTTLMCSNTLASDLTPLQGMRLQRLHIVNCQVSDLTPIQRMPLNELEIVGTSVTDLSPLKDLPLIRFKCDFQADRDAQILRAIKSLVTINGKPVAEFWKEVDATTHD